MEGHRYFTTGTVEWKGIIALGLTFLEPSHTCVIRDSSSKIAQRKHLGYCGSSCNDDLLVSQ